jgi:ABC-type phosphate transport system permease subunit
VYVQSLRYVEQGETMAATMEQQWSNNGTTMATTMATTLATTMATTTTNMANNKYGKQQVYSFFDNKKVLLLSVNITTAKTFNFSSNNQQQQRK